MYNNNKIDLIYNRLNDFRLLEESNINIRQSVLNSKVIITPHPAAFIRVSDKRNLSKIKSNVILSNNVISDYSIE